MEYLWVLGAFLQPLGHQLMELFEGRIVIVLPVRANSARALTCEVCAARTVAPSAVAPLRAKAAATTAAS